MIHIGIDPGNSGGVAVIDSHRSLVVTAKMPETERDLFDLLFAIRNDYGSGRAWLEQVSSSPQMGVVSAFTFGRGYGHIEMALIAVGIPFERVTPSKWQRSMGCLSRGDKNVTKRKAQELYPLAKITHAVADAVIIAAYGQRTYPA